MKSIWKFEFQVQDVVEIEMPQGARILSVGNQNKPYHICVWALVDPSAIKIKRTLYIFGTGQPVPQAITGSSFVGTVFDGPYVWHVFKG